MKTSLYIFIAFMAGVGIPIMATINSSLGLRLGSTSAASVILFALCFAVATSVYLLSGRPPLTSSAPMPVYYYLGGLGVLFYVFSITWVAPKFGIANAIFLVLIGQIISASIIDHFGLFGAPNVPLSAPRLTGILLMLAGVIFIRLAPMMKSD